MGDHGVPPVVGDADDITRVKVYSDLGDPEVALEAPSSQRVLRFTDVDVAAVVVRGALHPRPHGGGVVGVSHPPGLGPLGEDEEVVTGFGMPDGEGVLRLQHELGPEDLSDAEPRPYGPALVLRPARDLLPIGELKVVAELPASIVHDVLRRADAKVAAVADGRHDLAQLAGAELVVVVRLGGAGEVRRGEIGGAVDGHVAVPGDAVDVVEGPVPDREMVRAPFDDEGDVVVHETSELRCVDLIRGEGGRGDLFLCRALRQPPVDAFAPPVVATAEGAVLVLGVVGRRVFLDTAACQPDVGEPVHEAVSEGDAGGGAGGLESRCYALDLSCGHAVSHGCWWRASVDDPTERTVSVSTGSRLPRPIHGHARMPVTTSPWTSVSLKSRPW